MTRNVLLGLCMLAAVTWLLVSATRPTHITAQEAHTKAAAVVSYATLLPGPAVPSPGPKPKPDGAQVDEVLGPAEIKAAFAGVDLPQSKPPAEPAAESRPFVERCDCGPKWKENELAHARLKEKVDRLTAKVFPPKRDEAPQPAQAPAKASEEGCADGACSSGRFTFPRFGNGLFGRRRQ